MHFFPHCFGFFHVAGWNKSNPSYQFSHELLGLSWPTDSNMANENIFFRLPLELRNVIYRELAPLRHEYGWHWKLCTTPESCCLRHLSSSVDTSVLLVNKKIKLEYEREVFRTAQVEIHIQANMGIEVPVIWSIIPINTFRNIRHVVWAITMIQSDALDGKLRFHCLFEYFAHPR